MTRPSFILVLAGLAGCASDVTPDDVQDVRTRPDATPVDAGWTRPSGCAPCSPCDCLWSDPVGTAPRTTGILIGYGDVPPPGSRQAMANGHVARGGSHIETAPAFVTNAASDPQAGAPSTPYQTGARCIWGPPR